MDSRIDITVGDVTDMEAHVFARYIGPESVLLHGSLRGPFCERSRTLPADFEFRTFNAQQPNETEAIVTDPCMWTVEMPHVYQVNVEAYDGDRLVAEYHGTIGLQRLAPRRPVDFAPGTG
jgi:hypothetical protein